MDRFVLCYTIVKLPSAYFLLCIKSFELWLGSNWGLEDSCSRKLHCVSLPYRGCYNDWISALRHAQCALFNLHNMPTIINWWVAVKDSRASNKPKTQNICQVMFVDCLDPWSGNYGSVSLLTAFTVFSVTPYSWRKKRLDARLINVRTLIYFSSTDLVISCTITSLWQNMENRQNVYPLTDVIKTVKHRASSQVKFNRHENCYSDTELQ